VPSVAVDGAGLGCVARNPGSRKVPRRDAGFSFRWRAVHARLGSGCVCVRVSAAAPPAAVRDRGRLQ